MNYEEEIKKYPFKTGNYVYINGDYIGKIKLICDCEECRKRGFFEGIVYNDNGDFADVISNYDYKNGFKGYEFLKEKRKEKIDKELSTAKKIYRRDSVEKGIVKFGDICELHFNNGDKELAVYCNDVVDNNNDAKGTPMFYSINSDTPRPFDTLTREPKENMFDIYVLGNIYDLIKQGILK